MEPAKPVINTNYENEELKIINFVDEINIKNEKDNLIIKFGINGNINPNKLVLKANLLPSKDIYFFQNEYSYDDFKNLSKIFLMYDNLKDIISFLKTLKFEFVQREDILYIKFKVFLPNGQNQLIELNLKKQVGDDKDIIKILYKENLFLKEEIKFLKDDNKKLWKEINDLKNKNKLNDGINHDFFIFSSILSSKDDINFILNYIKEDDATFIFNELKLLFRGSIDGDDTILLHNKCDCKPNVLIIIKSDSGYIFGGYSKIGFYTDNNLKYLIDNNCFLFSINLKKIYPVIKNTKPICHIENSFGLCFYSCLVFYNNFNNKEGIVCSKNNKYFTGITEDFEMNEKNDIQ